MKYTKTIVSLSLILIVSASTYSQKKALESINKNDLKLHMEFLASDELEGRASGENGLNVAARYLAGQAEHIGLKPANGEDGYFQYYTIEERSYDWDQCELITTRNNGEIIKNEHPFFVFPGINDDELKISGEVVFAGYGIKDDTFDYDDFENVDITDKIVMILNRAPMTADGSESQFGEKWLGMQNFQFKMQHIAMQQPKAVFLVFDPKSKMNSIEDLNPDIVKYISNSRALKVEGTKDSEQSMGPKMALIHRSVADEILESTGKTLVELQNAIDETLEPQSFLIKGQHTDMKLVMKNKDLIVPNVFGIIEGSDPVLKDELVIYMAHFDHLGMGENGDVYNGADDNGSGTVALIEIAEAFLKEKKQPKRSVGFLWVSAEEIGLFGSTYFADHPLHPIENIVSAINLDMVGRTVSEEDISKGRKNMTIVGMDSVKVIGGKQSSVLMEINELVLEEFGLKPNYKYNNPKHPARYFYRSDHINFAKKDIPILFYSTGTHADYHEITDELEKIDYDKFLLMTKFCYKVGFNVANYKEEIIVDNPMSGW
jgi:hypothetical protein